MAVRVALNVPDDVGANFKVKVHSSPAATVFAHVVVSAKSFGLAPSSLASKSVKGVAPEFVRVTTLGVLVIPKRCGPKAQVCGFRVTVAAGPGAFPVPVTLTVSDCFDPASV